jgi:DNA (cytosine-5)-methyltransferase 1
VRPRLLDLFSGAGGAAVGYHRAGFDVVGVDVAAQPRYPFEFHRADALAFPLDGFDAIHASPPCQHFASITSVRGSQGNHPDLIAATRARLIAAGCPYVIENVPDARSSLREPVMLCGSAFGLPLKRHRYFESSVWMMSPGCAHGMHRKRYRIRQHGREMDTAFCYVFGGGQAGQPVAAWREAMGIDWMTVDELSQAIPPAYTEHIGGYLLTAVNGDARAAA